MSSSSGRTIKLIILDFDETLADLRVNWGRTRERIAKVCQQAGMHLNQNASRSLFDVIDEAPPIAKELFGIIKEEEMLAFKTASLMPGAADFLEYLAVRNLPFAMTSNNHHGVIAKTFEKFNLPKPVMIMGSDDVARHKPNPEGVNNILQSLSVSVQDCILVGNSNTDAELGKNAGIATFILSPEISFQTIKKFING